MPGSRKYDTVAKWNSHVCTGYIKTNRLCKDKGMGYTGGRTYSCNVSSYKVPTCRHQGM
jgi:hypothetical protein